MRKQSTDGDGTRQREQVHQPAFYAGDGTPVWRRCGTCKRRMRPGDATHTPYGEPVPHLWPSTDGICQECRPLVH